MMGQHGRNLRQRERQAEAAEAAREARRQSEMQQMAISTNRAYARTAEAEAFNREVAAIVGRTAVVAGAPAHKMFDSITLEAARHHGIRVVPLDDLPNFRAPGNSIDDYALSTVRYEVMHLLDHAAVRDNLRRCMHMNVTLAGGEVRYTISETALRTMDRGTIARDLVRALLDGLFKKLGR